MISVDYWKASSKDDLDTADQLFTSKKYHHSLFFVHLSLEKILKAQKWLEIGKKLYEDFSRNL